MHAHKRAKKLGLAYNLDSHTEAMRKRVSAMRCEMTGVPLIPGSGCGSPGKRVWNTVSLDRKDSTRGYTIDNIRVVCWAINAAMGTWGEQALRNMISSWQAKEAI
jgi:hypothetical protein